MRILGREVGWFKGRQVPIPSASYGASRRIGYSSTEHSPDQLRARYRKYVRTAITRTSQAVAGATFRVYTTDTAGSAFEYRAMTPRAVKSLMHSSGVVARNSLANKNAAGLAEVADRTHPLVDLLANPSPMYGWSQMVEQVQSALCIYGDAYLLMVGDPKRLPVELHVLDSMYVTPIINDERTGIGAYEYGLRVGGATTFQAEQVIHIRQYSPYYATRGMGDIEACYGDAELSEQYTDAALAMMARGPMPGIIIEAPQMANTDKLREFTDQLTAKISGLHRWFNALTLPFGWKASAFEPSQAAIQFQAEPTDRAIQAIATAFDMPLSMLRMDSTSLAEAATAVPLWQRQAIKPRVHRIEDALNSHLVPVFRRVLQDDGLVIIADGVIDRQYERDATTAASLYSTGLVTLNEARELIGEDPRDDGEELRSQTEYAPYIEPKRTESDYQTDRAEESDTEAAEKRVVVVERRSHLSWATDISALGLRVTHPAFGSTPCGRPSCHGHGHKAAAKLPRYMHDQTQAIARLVAAWILSIDASAVLSGEAITLPSTTIAAINAIIAEVGDSAAKELARSLGSPFDADSETYRLVSQDVLRRLRASQAVFADAVTKSVSALALRALADSLERGDNTAQQTEAIAAVLNIEADYRAERIARTETAWAYGSGRAATYNELGYKNKTFLVAPDPCEFCQAIAGRYDGKAIPMDQPFVDVGETIVGTQGGTYTVSYRPVLWGNVHPNCRCTYNGVRDDDV